MQGETRVPGPNGVSGANLRGRRPGPTGAQQGSEILRIAEQETYKLLSSAWAKHWRCYSDCWATCEHVARQICKARKVSYHLSLVKMFKHDKKWCQGNELLEAIARRNSGFCDVLISKSMTIYQGDLRGGVPTNTVSFTLKPGMCVYTAEGYMKESKKWRWALRHMRMYIGKSEYRDNSRRRRHGGPVWRKSPTLYVVLGIWDPFANIRPFLWNAVGNPLYCC